MSRITRAPATPPPLRHAREPLYWLLRMGRTGGRQRYDIRIFTDDNRAGLRSVARELRMRGYEVNIVLGPAYLAGTVRGSSTGPRAAQQFHTPQRVQDRASRVPSTE